MHGFIAPRIWSSCVITASFLLSACLFTAEPLLDETNSVAGEDSPELAHFLEVLLSNRSVGTGIKMSFTEELPDSLRRLRVGPKIGDLLTLQEELADCTYDHCVVYYAAKVNDYEMPEFCFVDTDATETLEAYAAEKGVELSIVRTNEDKVDLPPDIAVSGPREAVEKFIFGQFESGNIFCVEAENPYAGYPETPSEQDGEEPEIIVQ